MSCHNLLWIASQRTAAAAAKTVTTTMQTTTLLARHTRPQYRYPHQHYHHLQRRLYHGSSSTAGTLQQFSLRQPSLEGTNAVSGEGRHHQHQSNHQRRRSMMSLFPTTGNKSSTEASRVILEELNVDKKDNKKCNIPPHIADKVGRNLHLQSHHPLGILCQIIVNYFQFQENRLQSLTHISNLSPLVSTYENFDSLLIPSDHVSRSSSDTYYLNEETVLRTHTSAHQQGLLQQGHEAFLVSGDVYRRDDIDASHYPVFHQMEGVQLFQFARDDINDADHIDAVLDDLKIQLEGLAKHLFGKQVPMRWVEAYFPFTDPSLELEIWLPDHKQDDGWLEVLGCGVMQPRILQHSGIDLVTDTTSTKAWAFGLGLERLAMVLFDIPDIRLFWSTDERFLQQFANVHVPRVGEEEEKDENDDDDDEDVIVVDALGGWKSRLPKFQPYSKYPPVFKDIAFWLIPDEELEVLDDDDESAQKKKAFHVQDLNELVRQVAGDLVEQVELVDDFQHPKTGKRSHCYRITYRSMDRSLTNEEIDTLQQEVRTLVPTMLPGIELR